MVLTKAELIGSLKKEAHILSHLASKIEPAAIDYRPTPKQRSTLELLRYLTIMGPELIKAAKNGAFDPAAWTAAEQAAAARDFEQTVAALAAQGAEYERLLADVSDEDMRGEIEMFGRTVSRGSFFVDLVVCGHAAYRTQLFCYLKACGRDELNTMNLWAGMDSPAAAAV